MVLMPDACYLIPEGAIAQLGERLLCKQEVVGSIPSGSTRLRAIGLQAAGLTKLQPRGYRWRASERAAFAKLVR